MNNNKSAHEVAQAIVEMRSNSKVKVTAKSSIARRAIEALRDEMAIDKDESIGGVFIHETAKKLQTNYGKGKSHHAATAGVW